MLGVMGDAGGIAVAPFEKDLEDVALLPVAQGQAFASDVDARLLQHLAPGRGVQGLVTLLAAGDGLPVARVGGAFEQENLPLRGVDQHQYGNGALVGLGRLARG